MIRLLNILSIDVAISSCAMAYLWSYYFQRPVDTITYVALALVVWLIYTADHLLDVRQGKKYAGQRYEFHSRYQLLLLIVCGLVIVTLSVLLFYLNTNLLLTGTGLFLIVGIHFLYAHLITKKEVSYPKEGVVALVYVIGVSLPSISSMIDQFSWVVVFYQLSVLLLALINLFLLSYFEIKEDQKQELTSIAIHYGKEKTSRIIKGCFMVNSIVLVSSYLLPHTDNLISTLFLCMTGVYFLIFTKHSFFTVNERYRLLIDVVLMFPLVLLLIDKLN
ncbi:MAG: hypothetical protein AB8B61_01020 [Cyclobacteriaceae bacterium]